MARHLALLLDNKEIRGILARSRGNQLLVERLFSLKQNGDDPMDNSDSELLQERLASQLAELKLGRCDTLVAVNRTNIELKLLTLPPAPDDELPEMVRFQAQREMNVPGDDWPLDYISLDDDPTQARSVLAAAISPDQKVQISKICQQAGLLVTHIVPRPCGTASLLKRRFSEAGQGVCLIVDLLTNEVDMSVIADGREVFMRTARLSSHGDDPVSNPVAFQKNVLMELRRSLAAAQNQLGGRLVKSVYLCGFAESLDPLAQTIEQDFKLTVRCFDPLEAGRIEFASPSEKPAHPGRFAPLFGMLMDEAENLPHSIDFLLPKQKPKPASRLTKMLVGTGVALLLLVALIAAVTLRYSALEDQIAEQERIQEKLEDDLKETKLAAGIAAEIDKWVAGDILLIDEMDRLSMKLPDGDKTQLKGMGITMNSTGGKLTFYGAASDSALLSDIEDNLKDNQHHVQILRSKEVVGEKLPWEYTSSVDIQIREPFADFLKKQKRTRSSRRGRR